MISRSLSKPIGDARSALNTHWGPAAIAEHGHRRPAISGYWLDARVRVDRSNLFLQREGAATVVGIHLNESADVLERLANGLMRRDEDCVIFWRSSMASDGSRLIVMAPRRIGGA